MTARQRIGKRYEILPPIGFFEAQNVRLGPWWDFLKKYYGSVCWEEKRGLFLARYPNCNRCPAVATTVHHLNYLRIGNEYWEDLESLCLPCHELQHGREFTFV